MPDQLTGKGAIDLNLSSPALEKKAAELGFAYCATPQVFRITHRRDIAKLASSDGNARVICVEGSDGELLRKCAGEAHGNLLLVNASQVPRYFIDDGLIRAVAMESKEGKPVAFELPIKSFLSTSFVLRSRLVSQNGEFVRRCIKLHAPIVATSRASAEWELKAPKEVQAILSFYGLSPMQAAAAITSWPGGLMKRAGIVRA